ncbi:UPF0691 protein C9orf116-like protein [Elysia marginata]|uniref:UPF0691 protein C9orf116-like protein n=1 Tax=Elysia marginata TaxID=1093978 RepID=A0AAV4GKQ7_9GAST|nr:UPF0691 protein C9orf116-like protein [Elysia marginata]
MNQPKNKKVTFNEIPDVQFKAQQESCGSNHKEEPQVILDDRSHGCQHPPTPGVEMVNTCVAIEPSKCPENFEKSIPCAQTQSEGPKQINNPPLDRKNTKKTTLCPESSRKPTLRPEHGTYNYAPAHQILSDKLTEMRIEEDFRRENPIMRRQNFRYRGICGTLGNPVFTNTPVAPPEYKAKLPAHQVHGHPRPVVQHPMYSTTSADYGSCEPYLESTPIFYYPDDQSFTIERAIGGTYEDAHLTTELDKDALW